MVGIPAGASIERDVSEVFAFDSGPVVGSLKVTPDGAGLIGDVLFGEFARLERASALPLESKPARRRVFSKIANGMGYYTGLAVFNPGQEPAEVNIAVYVSGSQLGETMLNLAPGGRLSRLLTEVIPETAGQVDGFLILEANQPIVAQELFATEDILAAVPASIR